MAENAVTDKPVRRRRRNSIPADEQTKIATRVCEFYTTEWANRSAERDARLQRYAKYRMWSNGTDSPWPGASDQAIPDMLQDSLRVQDTLVNAVMSQKPPVVSRATDQSGQDKQKTVDRLIEHQIFVENSGEKMIGELAESFVNDPACTVFTPWVREKRQVADVQVYDPIPEEMNPRDYFFGLVRAKFPNAQGYDEKGAGWNWTVTVPAKNGKPEERTVCFYTDEADEVEMVVESEVITFDGPRPFVKDYDDVLFPARSANLQMPGPSNPNGAAYVILRDFPTLHEIRKLQASGFYDLLSDEDLERMGNVSGGAGRDGKSDAQQQKDTLSGANENPMKSKDKGHNRLTRLMCFDVYDGKDMIFWVIEETKTLIKARLLIDLYPSNPPRRPLDGESFLPVQGRYSGMSLLEIMESLHDAVKVIVDQSVNANDLAIASPGYYRPSGGMNPEVLRIEPFTLSPLQNPQQDIVFPQMGNPQAMGFALNMITTLGSWQDKLTMVTESSFGQVQPGASSALRTIGNMSLMQGQNEARPERILRRFFTILTGIWKQAHSLNQSFLPKGKQFRIAGVTLPGEDPYQKVDGANAIGGNFLFDFDANVLNTSKAALQQSLEKLIGTYVNPLFIQLGITTPDTVYRLARDYGRAQGQNVDQYLHPPTPGSSQPQILAEEAIHQIMSGLMPVGQPMEEGGPQEHMQKLTEFANSDEFGHFTPPMVEIFRAYLSQVQQLMAQQAQAQMLQQNAAQFAQGRQQGKPGAPTQSLQAPSVQPPMLSGPSEMMNETLPTAGGGANAV